MFATRRDLGFNELTSKPNIMETWASSRPVMGLFVPYVIMCHLLRRLREYCPLYIPSSTSLYWTSLEQAATRWCGLGKVRRALGHIGMYPTRLVRHKRHLRMHPTLLVRHNQHPGNSRTWITGIQEQVKLEIDSMRFCKLLRFAMERFETKQTFGIPRHECAFVSVLEKCKGQRLQVATYVDRF